MTDTKREATQEVAARDTTFDGITPKTAWVSLRTSPDRKYIVWYLDINGIEKEMGRFYVHSYDGILSHSQNLSMLIQPLQAQLASLLAKHERVLQMLEIAKKTLLAISLPITETINTTEVERLQTEAALEALAQIERLK